MKIINVFVHHDLHQNQQVNEVTAALHRLYSADGVSQSDFDEGHWEIEIWPTHEQAMQRQFEKTEGIYKPEATMPSPVVRVGWIHDLASADTTNYSEPVWYHEPTGTYYFGEG